MNTGHSILLCGYPVNIEDMICVHVLHLASEFLCPGGGKGGESHTKRLLPFLGSISTGLSSPVY